MALSYQPNCQPQAGQPVAVTDPVDGSTKQVVIPAVSLVSASGGASPAGTAADPSFSKPVGGSSINTNQITVGATATLIVAARAGRQSVSITTTAATVLYIGASGVTTTTGHYIAASAGATITVNTAAAVYGVVASGTLVVTFLENY